MKAGVISELKSEPILKAIIDVLHGRGIKAYFVGGVLRNLALSRPLGFDFDIVLEGDAGGAAHCVAERLNGSPFLLDKRLGSYRVVIKNGCGRRDAESGKNKKHIPHPTSNLPSFNIDLSPYKGKDIFEDLKNRDFTINAMALEIDVFFTKKKMDLIDIFNGQIDAKNRTLRMLKSEIFDDDPLRLLRAVRLSAQYDLTIDKETEKCIKKKADLLTVSSWERIRDEFFSILVCKKSVDYVKKLYELSLLQEILPEIRDWEDLKGYNLISHAFKTLEQGEVLFHNLKDFAAEFGDSIESYFQTPVGNISKKGLFKLALFSHDAGKPVTMKQEGARIRFIGHEVAGEAMSKNIGKRLKISRAAAAFVARLVRNHHRVFNLASLEKLTERSKAHMFRAVTGEDGIALALLSLADARATRNGDDPKLASFVKDLIDFYYKKYAVNKPHPLLNGNEVMKIFSVPEGVMVGRILKRLAEAEGEGIIKNKRDAAQLIKNWLEKSKEEE